MAIYVNKLEIGDIENLNSDVLDQLIRRHNQSLARLNGLYEAYMGLNSPSLLETEGTYHYVANYPRYIVNSLLGLYLGDPIRYTSSDVDESTIGTQVKAQLLNGQLVKARKIRKEEKSDITPILENYKKQTIS